jgi:hypothetical protein
MRSLKLRRGFGPALSIEPDRASITCDQENAGTEQCEARKDYCEHCPEPQCASAQLNDPTASCSDGAAFFGWV